MLRLVLWLLVFFAESLNLQKKLWPTLRIWQPSPPSWLQETLLIAFFHQTLDSHSDLVRLKTVHLENTEFFISIFYAGHESDHKLKLHSYSGCSNSVIVSSKESVLSVAILVVGREPPAGNLVYLNSSLFNWANWHC